MNGRWPLMLPEHRADRPEWPWWEATRLAAMRHHISAGDIVYDIGAEEGDFPALWSMWGAEVVLFEPNPRVWPNIRAIWQANGLDLPAAWYVGFASDTTAEEPEACDVNAEEHDGWPACAYGPLIGDHGFRHLAEETDTTPQVRLDDFVKRAGIYPTVLTLDIEGGELAALRGAERVLRDLRPVVFASLHPDALADFYGATTEDVRSFVRHCGYDETFLTTDHEEHWMFTPC